MYNEADLIAWLWLDGMSAEEEIEDEGSEI